MFRRKPGVWITLLVLMPFLGVFAAWLTGFMETYPPSSYSNGLPFPWKSTTYSYSGAWCPVIGEAACKLLGLSFQTVIDLNAFAIDATLFAAVGYSLLTGAYTLTTGVSNRGPFASDRIGSLFYYAMIPAFSVFVVVLTGLWGGMSQRTPGFPLGWQTTCPSNTLIAMACFAPSYSWTTFALDVLFYSILWVGVQLAYTRHLVGRRGIFGAMNTSKVPG